MKAEIVLILAIACTCGYGQFPSFPGLNQAQPPAQAKPIMDQRCLDCICEASSNCNLALKCHNGANGGYFCGPYVVSWAYWHDGGKPGDHGRAHDFETCLNNKTCAEMAVRGYMKKYGNDCDGSGTIDCFDYARIHKLGFGSCSGNAIYNSDYWQKFEICYVGHPVPEGDNRNDRSDPKDNSYGYEYDYGDDSIQARNKPAAGNTF